MNAVVEIIKDRAWWIEFYLENWARWMDSGGKPDELPDHASGGAENYTSMDWETCDKSYEQMDLRNAVMTNAVIEDLGPIERAAIYCQYLAAVFKFNRHDFNAVLRLAKLRIGRGLERRGIYLL